MQFQKSILIDKNRGCVLVKAARTPFARVTVLSSTQPVLATHTLAVSDNCHIVWDLVSYPDGSCQTNIQGLTGIPIDIDDL